MQTQTNRPLVVDLDGTLLRSDILIESAFAFVRQQPFRAYRLFFWLLSGKAHLKAKLTATAFLDVATLPYDAGVLAFIEQHKAEGRTLVLATASHQNYAQAIATHVGIFDRVLGTQGNINLSARAKRDVLVREYGEKGYDYLGNSRDDLKVWAAANKAYLANPELGVESAANSLGNIEQVIRTPAKPWRAWMKQLRLHQWAKNALIFVPLLASHKIGDTDLLLTGLLAFLMFGLCASSVYLLNDLLDLADDRQHASKRFRPLASGAVSIKAALLVLPALLVLAFAGSAWLLPWKFTLALGAYYALTLAYSLVLKRIITVDVITLAMLYTVRIVAGTLALNIILTFWMLAFSMFLFLSLALVKRYAELRESRNKGSNALTRGRGYYPGDLEMIASLGAASGYLAVMVLALYIQDQSTLALYRHPQVIWLACPLLLYWVTRIWMITQRGWMNDDPVVFAMKDRNSLLVGVLFAAVFWFAA